jgi:hypothetical protein
VPAVYRFALEHATILSSSRMHDHISSSSGE